MVEDLRRQRLDPGDQPGQLDQGLPGRADTEVGHRDEAAAVGTEDVVEDLMCAAGEGMDTVATRSDRGALLLLDRHDQTLGATTDKLTSITATFPKRA